MHVKKLVSDCGRSYLSAPIIVNVQLNSFCPLSCPFCFMSFADKKEMDWDRLRSYLEELKAIGCRTISFGQEEPMVSSIICKAVNLAHELGLRVMVATSGYGCTYNKLRRLQECGLDELHISLNSFVKEINEKSRDGYEYAITAVKIARSIQMPFVMTYVAQEETMVDFDKYIDSALENGASGISILREKVNHNGKIGCYSKKTLDIFRNHVLRSQIPIEIEECFCELKLLLSNRCPSALQGCAAGRALMAITVNGEFMPCPHLYKKREIFPSILEYWENSEILNNMRNIKLSEEPCTNCMNVNKCNSCQALYEDNRETYYKSRKNCPLYSEIR